MTRDEAVAKLDAAVEAHPRLVYGRFANIPWTCEHGNNFATWYAKELGHRTGECTGEVIARPFAALISDPTTASASDHVRIRKPNRKAAKPEHRGSRRTARKLARGR